MDFTPLNVTRKQLGAIYRAFKNGDLDGVSQADITALYDTFEGSGIVSNDYSAGSWNDTVLKVQNAAASCIKGDYGEAADTLRLALKSTYIVRPPDTATALEALRNAVDKGLVTVSKTGGGYLLTGATYDYKEAIKEACGAKWDKAKKAWVVTGEQSGLDDMLEKSKNVAKDTKKRAAKAAKDGTAELDRRRATQMRKAQREIEAVYKQALDDHNAELTRVMARYATASDPVEAIKLGYRRDELNAVIDALSQGLADAGTTAEQVASGHLVESRQVARDIAAWQIDNMAGMHVTRFLNDSSAIKALHSKFDKIAWRGVSSPRAAKKAVKQAISRGLLTGEHPSKIASRISGLFTGAEAGSPYKRAVRIANTETCRIMSEATQDALKDAQESGIELSNRWDATLDGRTRKSHRNVDGEIRKVGEKFSNGSRRPGDGKASEVINCRCCLTPVLDGFKPDMDTRRDNVTGERIPYQTYSEWYESRYASKPEKARADNKTGIDATAQVYKNVDEKYLKKIDEFVSGADAKARALYKRYESSFVLKDGNIKGGAYFSPSKDGVYMNLEKSMNDKRGALTTWFHEFGHNADYLSCEDSGYIRRYASVEYKDGLFGKTIKKEVDAIVNAKNKEMSAAFNKAKKAHDIDWLYDNGNLAGHEREIIKDLVEHWQDRDYLEYNGYFMVGYDKDPEAWFNAIIENEFDKIKHKKEYAYGAIEREIRAYSDKQRADISDIFEGATNGKIRAGWGHGKSYWKNQDEYYGVKHAGLAKEAFAEFTSARMSNPDSVAILEKYLPETAKVYDEILEAIEKGVIS